MNSFFNYFCILIFSSATGFADEHLNHYSQRFGVTASILENFHKSVLLQKINPTEINECTYKTMNSSDYVHCLTNVNLVANSEHFFKFTLKKIIEFYQEPQTEEIKKTIELNNYLLDVARTLLAVSKPHSFHWYDFQSQKFLKIKSDEKENYPFQNGDVLVAFGDKATSGMIARATGSVYRFSHAAIIHNDPKNQKLTTLESFPHLAAVELPISSIRQESYSRMIVLRLKKQYAKFSQGAIDQMQTWVKERLPFDPQFSNQSEDKNYCTRMVASSIAKSMNKNMLSVFPDQIRQIRPGLDRLHDQVGIQLPDLIVSPRTIIRSDYFDIVAEYGNSDTLLKFWQVDFITGYVESKMQNGYSIKSDNFFKFLSKALTFPIEISFSPLLLKSQRIIRLIGPEKFANLATTEKKIFESTIETFEKIHPNANILNFPPWTVAQKLNSFLEQSGKHFLIAGSESIP